MRAPHAVVAINAAAAGFGPLRSALAVTSSHMLITEPVPDVLEEIGWTGGESISTGGDLSALFPHDTGRAHRVRLGGGRVAYGARLGGRITDDAEIARRVHADLLTYFPALRGRRVAGAWGGPIDVSPIHLPEIGTLADGRVHYVHGFTGNGVGPTHLAGRVLASLALDQPRCAHPPRARRARAMCRCRRSRFATSAGRWCGPRWLARSGARMPGWRSTPLTRAVVDLPGRLGIHVGR